MIMSNLSTLYTVLADNYSFPPRALLACDLPTPASRPLRVPSPRPGADEGTGWRRKGCTAAVELCVGMGRGWQHCSSTAHRNRLRGESFKRLPHGCVDKCLRERTHPTLALHKPLAKSG